jgi:omega-hydroxy-beta-dihydromenaquinone-9 sulfotransferase
MNPQPLFGARALADWVFAGGAPQRRIPGHRWRAGWQAWWFEHHWRTEESRLAQLPNPADPLFITGLWRSGTTALHELLRAASSWPTPLTWQCFNPSTCFLTAPPRQDASTSRPMDEGRVTTLGAQEDEFALLLLGEPSVYRGFIDPRRLRASGERLWRQQEGELTRWQQFVRGVAAAADPGTRLLLKSPNHSFRLPLLCRWFPRCQFVWLGRHTGEVLASNARMWQAMCARYALWDCPPGQLEEFLRDMLRACVDVLEWCLTHLTREQFLWVDFEALRTDPRTVLAAVARFAQPSADPAMPAHWESAIDRAVEAVPVYTGQRSPMPPGPEVDELESIMCVMRERFGIPSAHNPQHFS